MKQMFKLFIISTLFLVACTVKIDGTSEESYKTSLEKIKSELPVEEQDSLAKSMLLIVLNSEIGLADAEKMRLQFDKKDANQIFAEAFVISEKLKQEEIKEKNRLDSLRSIFVADSITKYKAQGVWQLKYFVDEFKEETDEGYILNSGVGTFSNSATTNAKLTVELLITDDLRVQIFLNEYGSQPVKNFGRSGQNYKIKLAMDSEKYVTSGTMYSDRISFTDKKIFEFLERDGKLKMYFVEESEYTSSSTYLVEFDVTNYSKALYKLKNKE